MKDRYAYITIGNFFLQELLDEFIFPASKIVIESRKYGGNILVYPRCLFEIYLKCLCNEISPRRFMVLV